MKEKGHGGGTNPDMGMKKSFLKEVTSELSAKAWGEEEGILNRENRKYGRENDHGT